MRRNGAFVSMISTARGTLSTACRMYEAPPSHILPYIMQKELFIRKYMASIQNQSYELSSTALNSSVRPANDHLLVSRKKHHLSRQFLCQVSQGKSIQ